MICQWSQSNELSQWSGIKPTLAGSAETGGEKAVGYGELVLGISDDGYRLAEKFHEVYERLAPTFGYETRAESAKPWDEVPLRNQQLMAATCTEILKGGVEGAHEGRPFYCTHCESWSDGWPLSQKAPACTATVHTEDCKKTGECDRADDYETGVKSREPEKLNNAQESAAEFVDYAIAMVESGCSVDAIVATLKAAKDALAESSLSSPPPTDQSLSGDALPQANGKKQG